MENYAIKCKRNNHIYCNKKSLQNLEKMKLQFCSIFNISPVWKDLQRRTLPFWKRLGMYIKWLKGFFCKKKIKDAIIENARLLFFASPSSSKKKACHALDHFKLLKGVAGAFFEKHPPNLAKLFVFCRSIIDITITFGYMWLYEIWKKWKSFPLHIFRASWIKIGCLYPLRVHFLV